ncbi:MAG TPA: hypothetical protein VKT80_02105 [Chloroflexota bacterium]|nr:hypothetical protein [Chloroflexota bacterium]
MAVADTFYDLDRLISLRKVLREVGDALEPQIRFLSPGATHRVRRLALLPGSFNPPTVAHLALARSVLDSALVDRVDFVLATRTINKERLEGLSLDDRLLLLLGLIEGEPDLGLVVVNRGLYVDQAEAVRAAVPALDQLSFIVGFDKIVQIFDPRYYVDREAALRRLFDLASFFVAPRGDKDFGDLDALLRTAENRQFASGVTPLALAPGLRDVSSSRLRDRAAANAGLPDVSPLIAEFLEETGAFAAPIRGPNGQAVDRYAWREHLVDLGARGQLSITSPREFRDLIRSGTSTDPPRNRIHETPTAGPSAKSSAGSSGRSF